MSCSTDIGAAMLRARRAWRATRDVGPSGAPCSHFAQQAYARALPDEPPLDHAGTRDEPNQCDRRGMRRLLHGRTSIGQLGPFASRIRASAVTRVVSSSSATPTYSAS